MSNIMSFEDSVKLKLKSVVADLIPEEKWNQIVYTTVMEFEKKDLPELIRKELIVKYKEAIAVEFSKPEWQAKWGMAGMEASPALQKMLLDVAPLILTSMIGASVQTTLSQLQYNISRS